MAGVREKKKAKTEDSILRSASYLFAKKGYEHTTIDEIAERAVVGIGTVYNYFGSKRGLLMALMTVETKEIIASGTAFLSRAHGDPVMAVADLLWLYMEACLKLNRGLLLEAIKAAFAEPESVGKDMVSLDYLLVGQIGELLGKFKKEGTIEKSLPVEHASLILYSTFGSFLLMYLQDEISRKKFKREIRDSVKLIFRSWTTEPGK